MTAAPSAPGGWRQEWRPVTGWESKYEVSNLGIIREIAGHRILGQWPSHGGNGYLLVRLSQPRCQISVHRVVAIAFVPNPEGKPSVNHIDCDRTNNAASNLEWCTQKENIQHADRLGRLQKTYWLGRRSPNARLTDDEVREIRALCASGVSWAELGRRYSVSKRRIGDVIHRASYSYVE